MLYDGEGSVARYSRGIYQDSFRKDTRFGSTVQPEMARYYNKMWWSETVWFKEDITSFKVGIVSRVSWEGH